MKILAIWITKGLFIFVVCIADWNVCSNLGTIHCIRLVQEKGATQSYSFPAMVGDRRPFLYCHGSQNHGETTLICGVIHSTGGIITYDKICGKANVTIEGLTITSTLIGSWASGYVIYFS